MAVKCRFMDFMHKKYGYFYDKSHIKITDLLQNKYKPIKKVLTKGIIWCIMPFVMF